MGAYVGVVVDCYDFDEAVDDVVLVEGRGYVGEPLHVFVDRIIVDTEGGHGVGPGG